MNPSHTSGTVRGSATRLLIDWSNGDESARGKLFEMLYSELLVLAKTRRVRPDQTLQPADLVHALWERLIGMPAVDLSKVARPSRAYFFYLALRVMSNRVCDYLRQKYADKRKGIKVSVDEIIRSEEPDMGAVADVGLAIRNAENSLIDFVLHERFRECLDQLLDHERAVLDARITGLTVNETAELLGISAATVKRRQAMAEARVRQCLGVPRQTGAS